MKWLKEIGSWLLVVFNIDLYMFDGIDSLLIELYELDMAQHAENIQNIYLNIQFIESFKCILMLLSLLFLVIANASTFASFSLYLQEKIVAVYQAATGFISKHCKNLKTKLKLIFSKTKP